MNTTLADIHATLKTSHQSRLLWPLAARKAALKQLQKALVKNEERIYHALAQDLSRSHFESYVLEIAIIKQEITTALQSLSGWSKKQAVPTPLPFQPGTTWVEPTPKGVVLIIAPWNYPFQLSLVPLISAIAAGNCVMIKPSEIASASALVIADIVTDYLDPRCFRVINGDIHTAQKLLDMPFDHIFYTGSTRVGIEVMKKAALNLTPVTLELGGKSPAIIDESCNLDLSVKRLLWGKCINAGQTCIAPDYVLIPHHMIKDFINKAKQHINTMFGSNKAASNSYGRIINQAHFGRLVGYLKDGLIAHGGSYNQESRFIEPTLLIDVKPDSAVMRDEIFGPILPIIGVDDMHHAIDFIVRRPHPLALYIFSQNQQSIETVIKNTSSGSVCVNDCLSQAGIKDLPFGGVGLSGFGNYHGKYGFLTFSYLRAVHQRSMHLDNPIRYAPYSDQKLKIARLLI